MPLDPCTHMITRHQGLAARRLLGWSPERLAQMSGLPISSIFPWERIGLADKREVEAMRAALQAGGLEFTDDNPGVRLLAQPTSL